MAWYDYLGATGDTLSDVGQAVHGVQRERRLDSLKDAEELRSEAEMELEARRLTGQEAQWESTRSINERAEARADAGETRDAENFRITQENRFLADRELSPDGKTAVLSQDEANEWLKIAGPGAAGRLTKDQVNGNKVLLSLLPAQADTLLQGQFTRGREAEQRAWYDQWQNKPPQTDEEVAMFLQGGAAVGVGQDELIARLPQSAQRAIERQEAISAFGGRLKLAEAERPLLLIAEQINSLEANKEQMSEEEYLRELQRLTNNLYRASQTAFPSGYGGPSVTVDGFDQ